MVSLTPNLCHYQAITGTLIIAPVIKSMSIEFIYQIFPTNWSIHDIR